MHIIFYIIYNVNVYIEIYKNMLPVHIEELFVKTMKTLLIKLFCTKKS